jgi:hypothetical protein
MEKGGVLKAVPTAKKGYCKWELFIKKEVIFGG